LQRRKRDIFVEPKQINFHAPSGSGIFRAWPTPARAASKSLRALPGCRRTPVIYVTGHSDFESRAKSVLSGGNDLIAKPVFPMELRVKAMTHLLKSQLADQKPAR